jgi:hypothetical protein
LGAIRHAAAAFYFAPERLFIYRQRLPLIGPGQIRTKSLPDFVEEASGDRANTCSSDQFTNRKLSK